MLAREGHSAAGCGVGGRRGACRWAAHHGRCSCGPSRPSIGTARVRSAVARRVRNRARRPVGALCWVCGTACEAYPETAAGRTRHAHLTRQAGMPCPSRRALPARAPRRWLARATDVHLSHPAQSVVQPTTHWLWAVRGRRSVTRASDVVADVHEIEQSSEARIFGRHVERSRRRLVGRPQR